MNIQKSWFDYQHAHNTRYIVLLIGHLNPMCNNLTVKMLAERIGFCYVIYANKYIYFQTKTF